MKSCSWCCVLENELTLRESKEYSTRVYANELTLRPSSWRRVHEIDSLLHELLPGTRSLGEFVCMNLTRVLTTLGKGEFTLMKAPPRTRSQVSLFACLAKYTLPSAMVSLFS